MENNGDNDAGKRKGPNDDVGGVVWKRLALLYVNQYLDAHVSVRPCIPRSAVVPSIKYKVEDLILRTI